jgi:amino acid transporter
MQILVVTSLFAGTLAVHCHTSRYHYALARDRLLPRALAHTHPRYGSPIVASAVQLGIVAIVVIPFAIAGKNPYIQMGTALYGLGVIGVIVLEAIASVAIVGFFLKRTEDVSRWGTIVAPSLGALGLTTGLAFMIRYYSTFTGSKEAWINELPWLLVLVALLGAIAASELRRSEPFEYERITEEEPAGLTVEQPSATL